VSALTSIVRLHGEACIACGSTDHPLFPVDQEVIEGRPIVVCGVHRSVSPDEWPLAALEAEFPGWRVWRASSLWCATRRDVSAGVDLTVVCDSAQELREALLDQRKQVARGPRGKLVITR
jgi:hypothetical protein